MVGHRDVARNPPISVLGGTALAARCENRSPFVRAHRLVFFLVLIVVFTVSTRLFIFPLPSLVYLFGRDHLLYFHFYNIVPIMADRVPS